MDKLRLFVAVDIPDKIRKAIGEEMGRQGIQRGLRWVKPSQAHITLKFLGGVEQRDVPILAQRLEKVASSHQTATLVLDSCGAFPFLRKARVLWLGFTGELDEVASLAEDIDRKVQKLGVKREERKFRPHLTIARCRDPQDLSPLKKEWEVWLEDLEETAFRVDGFVLYRSILHPEGPEYIKIEEFRLEGGQREDQ